MYPRLRPLQRGQTKPFGQRCAVRCSPHRTSSPKRERNSLTVMMGFLFNRLGFFISDIISSFVRLFKLDIHLTMLVLVLLEFSVPTQVRARKWAASPGDARICPKDDAMVDALEIVATQCGPPTSFELRT